MRYILTLIVICSVPFLLCDAKGTPKDYVINGDSVPGYIVITPNGYNVFFLDENSAIEYAKVFSAANAGIPIFVSEAKEVQAVYGH